MERYFLGFRLKEYLTLRNIDHKLRKYYLQQAYEFFDDMDEQLNDFDAVEDYFGDENPFNQQVSSEVM
jgi:type IV secretory pathway TrbF-like protein